MVLFTFRVHTQASSSDLLALRNTGYANSCVHPHTQTHTQRHVHAYTRSKISLVFVHSQTTET